MTEPFTIAIDGPAAAGKGTISKAVAAHFNMAHLDTGLLYRAVGARMLAGEDAVTAARALVASDLDNDSLRTQAVAQAASQVAVIAEVRAALLDFQRAFARRAGGAVLRGQPADLDAVTADVKARDARDMDRAEAPLRPADDAVLIDTSDKTIDEAVAAAIAAVNAAKG